MNVLEEMFRPQQVTIHKRKKLEPPNIDQDPSGRIRMCSKVVDPVSGYGRLQTAVQEALNPIMVTDCDQYDFTLAPPHIYLSRPCIRFTMWESDMLPPNRRNFLGSSALITPCRHNVSAFRRSGFEGPIKVVPLYGEATYSPMPDESTLRFVCVARDNGVRGRKGIDLLVECFKEAFPNRRDVSLSVKMSPHCFPRTSDDQRIKILHEDWSKEQYEKFLAGHHCGVFLSGMEGWNFPACELMAAGRPSILIPHAGPAEFTTKYTSWYLDYDIAKAPDEEPYIGYGLVATPIKSSVIEALREAYHNRGLLHFKAEQSYQESKQYTKEIFKARLQVAVKQLLSTV